MQIGRQVAGVENGTGRLGRGEGRGWQWSACLEGFDGLLHQIDQILPPHELLTFSQSTLDHFDDSLGLCRLEHVIKSTLPQSTYRRVDGGMRSEQDAYGAWRMLLHILQNLQAAEPRHLNVEDDQIKGCL